MRPRTRLAIVLTAIAAAPAWAQPSPVMKGKALPGVELMKVQPGATLKEVLTRPDVTKVILADGKETTVGEIRRAASMRDQRLVSLKTVPVSLPGRLRAIRTDGMAKVKALASLVAGENSAAQAAHAASLSPSKSLRASAMIMKNFEGILKVNGKARGWIVTPGGYVTIDGDGFGDTLGLVNVFGQFPGGEQALHPIDWRSNQIYAQFPPGLSGVLDQDVVLQVVTAARKTHRLEGGKFYATRGEEFTMRNQIHRLIGFRPGEGGVTMNDNGLVNRLDHGESIDCFPPGSDGLHALDPGRGFVVTGIGAHFGRTDSGDGDQWGDAGNRIFAPGYEFGDWVGDDIRIRWGVWRSHSSPSLGGLVPAMNWCSSRYQIEVSVQGPLGVAF